MTTPPAEGYSETVASDGSSAPAVGDGVTGLVVCEGAPRALGLDQGRACVLAVRAGLAARGLRTRPRWLPMPRRLAGGAVLGAGVGREVLRHQPHLGERMSGIARAARVPLESLMEDVVASAYGADDHPLAAPALVGGARDDGQGPMLARAFDPAHPWIVRRSRPEVGFASVEITLPWLAGAVGGVNAAGLAIVAGAPAAPRRDRGLRAGPAWLLVQDCLQRFEALEGALEWCLRRPSAGEAMLLLADPSGELAVVEVSGEQARLRERGVERVVAGGREAEAAEARKRIAAGEVVVPEWPGAADAAEPAGGLLVLRPGERGLVWRSAGGQSARLTAEG